MGKIIEEMGKIIEGTGITAQRSAGSATVNFGANRENHTIVPLE
jgi:hypothetical protein